MVWSVVGGVVLLIVGIVLVLCGRGGHGKQRESKVSSSLCGSRPRCCEGTGSCPRCCAGQG